MSKAPIKIITDKTKPLWLTSIFSKIEVLQTKEDFNLSDKNLKEIADDAASLNLGLYTHAFHIHKEMPHSEQQTTTLLNTLMKISNREKQEKENASKKQLEGLAKQIKPPKGLRPEAMWINQRIVEIQKAINRYIDERKHIPTDWVKQYNTCINTLVDIDDREPKYKNTLDNTPNKYSPIELSFVADALAKTGMKAKDDIQNFTNAIRGEPSTRTVQEMLATEFDIRQEEKEKGSILNEGWMDVVRKEIKKEINKKEVGNKEPKVKTVLTENDATEIWVDVAKALSIPQRVLLSIAKETVKQLSVRVSSIPCDQTLKDEIDKEVEKAVSNTDWT